MKYAVITQNDESPWDDVKGDLYHYPSTYKSILTPGTKIIYYKGKLRNKKYASKRLASEPHYFGIGLVGNSIPDSESKKSDYYCEILDYKEFEKAVLAKKDDEYLEVIPESRKSNYWRFGVRQIDEDTYVKILDSVKTIEYMPNLPSERGELESYSKEEGRRKVRYSSYYERLPHYREEAIRIHGLSCLACGFNFEKTYGGHGKGFIHVHHNKPISERGVTIINPKTDLSTLCPNCHAMVHRNKHTTLSIEAVQELIKKNI